MANTSHPFGFRASRYLDGSPFNGQTQLYAFSASQANNAYIGDVVGIDTTNRMTAITDPYAPGIPLILPFVSAMTTTVFRGVLLGLLPQPEFNQSTTASLGLRYRVASTARYGWVAGDDIGVVFQVQEAGNSYVSASSNGINKCADIDYTAGSAITGISGVKLSSTFSTNSVRPWRALRYSQLVDNFGFTAADTNSYAQFDVLIANSDLAQANNGA